MEKFTGKLSQLEVAGVGPKATNYSWIEIGDKTLQTKIVATALDKYLQAAFHEKGSVTIWIADNLIVGVRLPNSKTYISEYRFGGTDWLLMTVWACLIVVGIGFIFLAISANSYMNLRSINFKTKNAVADPLAIALPAFV